MREMALAALMSSSSFVLVRSDSSAVAKPASPKPLRTTADRKQEKLHKCSEKCTAKSEEVD